MSIDDLYNESLLLRQISEDDEAAFRTIFNLYKDRFYGVAFKMSASEYVAEEMVQEVFITIWNKRSLLTNIDKPSSYLFAIFYRCLYQRYKKEAIERRLKNEILEMSLQSAVSVDDRLLLEEQYQLLEQAIAALPPQQAMVYKLSKQDGLSREEVAKQMGISPNTVKNHLAEAIRTLKRFSKKAGLLLLYIGFYIHI